MGLSYKTGKKFPVVPFLIQGNNLAKCKVAQDAMHYVANSFLRSGYFNTRSYFVGLNQAFIIVHDQTYFTVALMMTRDMKIQQ